MSAQTAGPETLGQLTDAPQNEDPNSKRAKAITGKSPLRIAMSRLLRDKIAVACLVIVLLFVIVAVFAGTISKILGVDTSQPLPSQFLDLSGIPIVGPPNNGFQAAHPFGIAPRTAQDNLAFWLYGCRNSLEIAVTATVVSSVVGIALGLLAGFSGGVIDKVISFITDFFLTIPFLLAALSIAPILNERFAQSNGGTIPLIGLTVNYQAIQVLALVAVLAIFGWMGVARLIRGETLSLREREFVQAARVLGMPTRRILIRELLPNLTAPIIVSISLALPAYVAAESGLAFLGIGVTSRPSWGQTIDRGTSYFNTYPLYMYEPLVGVVLLVLALNLLGDALRDALDPKTRR